MLYFFDWALVKYPGGQVRKFHRYRASVREEWYSNSGSFCTRTMKAENNVPRVGL